MNEISVYGMVKNGDLSIQVKVDDVETDTTSLPIATIPDDTMVKILNFWIKKDE